MERNAGGGADGGCDARRACGRCARMRAERERVIKEAEMKRRADMAKEEASANNIVEEVDGGEGGAEGATGADSSAFAADDDDGDESGGEEEEVEEAEDFD